MEGGRWRSDWEKIIPRLKRPPVPRKEVYSVVRWHWRQSADPWPPGGELRHEGPLHRGQGQIPDPRLQMQFVRQAGVRGPGVQFILLQEILPPLCPGEHGCFPSGNPARLGEKESSIKEACQPAGVSDMSLVGVRSTAVPCMGLPGHLACGLPCFWTRKSSVCSPGELRSPCSSSRARSHAEKAPKRQPQTPVLQS
uniref:Cysteine-rich DPF motif domain-containing protein 1 isoform X5 n=1 Tax=Camelus bactrianus TaxID=9837 RepID=A0A9W3HLT4_CAMBA|nr:cysteine-rich DPF motif domain-containing protein 1 isoform X5 [Camelus bactrianus]